MCGSADYKDGGHRLCDEPKPATVYDLRVGDRGAPPKVAGGFYQPNKSRTQRLTCDFKLVPSGIPRGSTVEVELNHAIRQRGPICAFVKRRRRHDPHPRKFHLAKVQQTEHIHKFRAYWKMVPVKTYSAADAMVAIDANRAFHLNVDVLEPTSKINNDVFAIDIRKRAI